MKIFQKQLINLFEFFVLMTSLIGSCLAGVALYIYKQSILLMIIATLVLAYPAIIRLTQVLIKNGELNKQSMEELAEKLYQQKEFREKNNKKPHLKRIK